MSAARNLKTEMQNEQDRRDRRVCEHLSIPKLAARRMARRLPSSVDLNDLVSAGNLALVSAAERYEESRGVPFEPYAQRRVQGAMLDFLRGEDHLTRAERKSARQPVSGINVAPSHAFVPLEDADESQLHSETETSPFELYAKDERVGQLRAALAKLPARDQTILSLYYERDLTLREIGVVLAVTESRVCQLLKVAIDRLRDSLTA
ncbi:MAG: sigma-70 family RNA polymerase sigma factor [Deltaproteobacteria bacterium]|nr:sigma-70 family RNA polymerase sigma factor [Deltaproteobacteria bacterium]